MDRADELIARLPSPFRLEDAKSAGIPRSTLYRWRDSGVIIAIGRGLYRTSSHDLIDLDLAEIASRARHATLCLTTALVEHNLSDAIPNSLDVALPRNTWTPKVGAPVRWHHFDSSTFEHGRGQRKILGSQLTIGLYSAERTLCDLARMPNRDQSELTEALRRWLRQQDNTPAKLLATSRSIPQSTPPLQHLLEILS
jgi:hypothetical protein